MRIEASQISPRLRRMLLEKAQRPDLAENGFDLQDEIWERSKSLFPGDPDHARYHALFDKSGLASNVPIPPGVPGADHTNVRLWNAHYASAQATRELVNSSVEKILDEHREQSLNLGSALKAVSDGYGRLSLAHEQSASAMLSAIERQHSDFEAGIAAAEQRHGRIESLTRNELLSICNRITDLGTAQAKTEAANADRWRMSRKEHWIQTGIIGGSILLGFVSLMFGMRIP